MALGLSKLLTSSAAALDRRFGWDKLPRPLGVLTLVGLRTRLREKNLYDTGTGGATAAPSSGPHNTRTFDGSYNDLEQPAMGMVGTRFGRNVPLDAHLSRAAAAAARAEPAARQPRAAHARRFKPATTLNVLAAAWLQFKVHDWFSHGKNDPEEPFELALADDDPWPERPMRILRTRSDPAPDAKGGPPTYVTADRTGGTGRRSTAASPTSRPRCARTRAASSGSTTASCRGTSRSTSTSPASPATSGSGWRCCTRCSRASTTRSATACARVPALVGRRAVRPRAADQRGADGQDPHRRVDAGDHRPPDDQVRDARELVRHARQAPGQAAARTRCSAASPARRPTTTACPTR